MHLKLELSKGVICDAITSGLTYTEIDPDKIADTTAIKALSEIQEVIHNEKKTDFEIVDEIVDIFAKYKIDFGGCHDF